MAKKQKTKPAIDGEKVAFQVRFDRDLHEQLAELSEKSGISLNQLVQGICRGAMAAAIPGEWSKGTTVHGGPDEEFWSTTEAKGCVWFGRKGTGLGMGTSWEPGAFWFGIDVRERGDVHLG